MHIPSTTHPLWGIPKYLAMLALGCGAGLIAFFSMVSVVHAIDCQSSAGPGTCVSRAPLDQDAVWTKQGSPYILSGQMHVLDGATLTIEAGAEIVAGDVTAKLIIEKGGSLRVLGVPQERVIFRGPALGINIMDQGASAHIANADFLSFGSIYASLGTLTFHRSTISGNSGAGMIISGADVEISESRIERNGNAAFTIQPTSVRQPSVKISQSAIVDNEKYIAWNSSGYFADVRDNWWGADADPTKANPQLVPNFMDYKPWLDHDPVPHLAQKPTCCSSILFIPGLQATRLYQGSNTLWEPNRNDDVRKLYLDASGSSIDSTIYSGGPIGKALGIKPVYDSFMRYMDSLVSQGRISEWRAFGYDWRKPIPEVVDGSERKATTTESLVETLRELASRSTTGQVTIVAHSNGGLVAKQLVKRLADQGEDNLVDKVISVAVPYAGTPQTIAGLLHGDGQSIAGGLILKKSVAKELGTNMPSAYSLLPSAAYFARVVGPAVAFAREDKKQDISSSAALIQFVGQRANATLAQAAKALHDAIDPFPWPAKIARWAIVGWGKSTVSGVSYKGDKHSLLTTTMGDGTVISRSGTYEAGTTTAIDLVSASKEESRNIDHSNILESVTVQKSIDEIIGKSEFSAYDPAAIERVISSIPNASIGEPQQIERAELVISTHSPVELHVYDAYGNHTGLATLPAELDVEEGLYDFVEIDIPGSHFYISGDDGSPETYIRLPDIPGEKYSVQIQGIGVGKFTYQVERVQGDRVLSRVVYEGLPTTPLMLASTSVETGASTTNDLHVDVDGDGEVDVIAQGNRPLDSKQFFRCLRKAVSSLDLPKKRIDSLLKKLDNAEKKYDKHNKPKHPSKKVMRLHSLFKGQKLKNLSQKEREEIAGLFEDFAEAMEWK